MRESIIALGRNDGVLRQAFALIRQLQSIESPVGGQGREELIAQVWDCIGQRLRHLMELDEKKRKDFQALHSV